MTPDSLSLRLAYALFLLLIGATHVFCKDGQLVVSTVLHQDGSLQQGGSRGQKGARPEGNTFKGSGGP